MRACVHLCAFGVFFVYVKFLCVCVCKRKGVCESIAEVGNVAKGLVWGSVGVVWCSFRCPPVQRTWRFATKPLSPHELSLVHQVRTCSELSLKMFEFRL